MLTFRVKIFRVKLEKLDLELKFVMYSLFYKLTFGTFHSFSAQPSLTTNFHISPEWVNFKHEYLAKVILICLSATYLKLVT